MGGNKGGPGWSRGPGVSQRKSPGVPKETLVSHPGFRIEQNRNLWSRGPLKGAFGASGSERIDRGGNCPNGVSLGRGSFPRGPPQGFPIRGVKVRLGSGGLTPRGGDRPGDAQGPRVLGPFSTQVWAPGGLHREGKGSKGFRRRGGKRFTTGSLFGGLPWPIGAGAQKGGGNSRWSSPSGGGGETGENRGGNAGGKPGQH